jgi:hypothetical protein
MATVFWDSKRELMVEFMQQGTTIMSEVYCKKKKRLRRAIQNKRSGMLTFGVFFLHDTADLHTATHTQALLVYFTWEFDNSPYSPDCALSDFRLFTYLKNWLGSQHFSSNEELMEGVKTWLSSQVADFFDTGIQNLP